MKFYFLPTVRFSTCISRIGWLLIVAFVLNNCSYNNNPEFTQLKVVTLTPSPQTLSITEIPLEQAMPHFQDNVSLEKLNGIESITKSGMRAVHTIARFGPGDQDMTSGVYTILQPGQGLSGYLLLNDTLKYSHDFRLVGTLDYLPIQLDFNGTLQAFPELTLEAGTQRAFKFSLPPLPEGLHTIIVTFIVEPDHYFSFDPTEDFDPAENEAMSFRSMPFEFGLLIWITSTPPQSISDWPEQARSIEPEKSTLLMESALLREKPAPGSPGMLFLNKDTVRVGEVVTYYTRFVAPEIGEGNIPLRILIFWDETFTQTDELSIPVQAAIQNEYIPYDIRVPSNLSEGPHILTVVSYPYPYYLRGWEDASEWLTDVGPFSNLMARLPVEVEAPKE